VKRVPGTELWRGLAAVKRVAHDRTAQVRQVRADLVAESALDAELDQREART
jgi:hypothetical protein